MSSSIQNLDHLKIPLKAILVATNNFSSENFIRQGGFGKIYKGKLKRSGGWIDIVARRLDEKYGQGSKEFWTEILMLSKLEHENLVSLVGFCDEKNEKIVINKYEANGSLDNFITDPTFIWRKRLNICVDIAHALSCIHYDKKRDFSLIHRNIKSSKILLDFFGAHKLSGFNLSVTTVASRRDRLCIEDACGSTGYFDPAYVKTGTVTHKSDIYSFGVVLFEVLSGKKAITDKGDIQLAKEAKSRYENEQLDNWINPDLRKQMAGESLKIFSKTAYACLNEHRAERPNIHQVVKKLEKALDLQVLQINKALQANGGSYIQELQGRYPILDIRAFEGTSSDRKESQELQEEKNNLQISLAAIKLATQNFSRDNLIGKGGFGQVYKGKIQCSGGHKFIAAKRLDKTSDQGEHELMTELVILSEYKHMNVIDLVSYCNENGEKVIVYDNASNGSLDRWLKREELTWRERLQICIDIARGLAFLHGTSDVKQEVVIHRDIKSANILLDDDWKASIADFGLSLISPINQDINFVIDNVKGTPGYCDPQYITTGFLTKESDIYSFGVLLFEVLCGRFVMEDNSSRAQNLVHLVRHHFEEGTLYEMVFEATKKQMAAISMTIFQNIAYQCLHEEKSKRPTAYDVLTQLTRAWELQVNESILSSSLQEFAHLQIPLEDIALATGNFADENFIGHGGFGKLYRGKLLRSGKLIDIVTHRLDGIISGQGAVDFSMEISMLSILKHENMVSFLGFCDENGEKIIIYEHAVQGCLDQYLSDPTLTWSQRLQICIGVARALDHIHYDVIHCNINSSQVLIDKDWEAKVYGFGLSTKYPESWSHRLLFSPYFDASGCGDAFLTPKYDVYSFGRILSEVFSGWKEISGDSGVNQSLAAMATRHHVEKQLDEYIDPNPRDQTESQTLTMLSEIADKCLNQHMQRPSMDQILKELEEVLELHELKHKDQEPRTNADEGKSSSRLKEEDIKCLEIPLRDIKLATNEFDPTYLIGKGGYGEVYKADVGHLDFQGINSTMAGHGTVAIKRIFNKEGQNKQEFYKEVEMLNSCKHQNIVSLLGISTEESEMILVCEFASNGSLEDCLEKGKMINVTWAQRLSICLDIAKGLKYLHTEFPQKSRILHRDVKSANILLDEEWNAKISDFGLSKFNPMNQQGSTMIFTRIAGTDVYLDPEYMKKGKYKKASDVYSFGIVLFEILSGTLAYNSVYKEGNDKGLATVVRRRFNEGTLKELIDPNMMREDNEHNFTVNKGPNLDSFDAFSKIAYQCLAETQVRRPTMETIIKELQNAITLQGKTLVLMKFRLRNIVNATNNFSDKYCMGVGTYGKMYNAELDHFGSTRKSLPDIEGKNEGRLPNRRIIVALKRMFNELGHGKQGFFAEIGMLTRCKHPNIVSLLGISCEDREMILVYKDAYNGSLSDCLRNTRKVANLSWVQRIQISLDIAQGLNYLFTRTEDTQMLMHFEMSSANILLDANWKAKITCYWHSNLYAANQEANILNTNSIGGTKVHLDPDHIRMGKLKNEHGTYSFGVILFEILSGRLENDDINVVENEKRLTSVARRHFEEGTLIEIIDPNMMEKANESFIRPNQDSLAAFSKIAYQCLAETDQAKRPTMQVIIEELQNALYLQKQDTGMEISHPSHQHRLVLKYANCPYYCWGCDQLGFGLSYICQQNGCNFFLHEQCGRPQSQVDYPFSFSKKCVLKFQDGGPGEGSPCDACGKKIKRFHYRCLCTFKKRHLHPSCFGHQKTLEAAHGLTLNLADSATTKCLHCGTKNLWSNVRGWAYVSSCESYCYHVSCVMEIINTNWRSGFFTGKSDPFQTIKEQFPEDMDKMHQLVVAKKKEKPTGKQASLILSVIFNVITGNPLGLIGAAQSYFSN